ncbi:hypothetical protein SCBWM1_gp59 [Synechococcus phage S-CBWM1]|uniref:Uncharacterized protein n=1 Tax=Synechococcus phage S-CBWM1 TaxID=2053653 RepID=A0A3G1L3I4_9CAUD|nr:hypothetical protein HOU61_gp138 [Synechococcus phage S-CBWM1]ATW62743.1 hypothetical protein SCBWM1_gp59 [Synechococcus phage S-CBWM1]
MITARVQPSVLSVGDDWVIQFPDELMEELEWKEGDVVVFSLCADGVTMRLEGK